jgi:undecaprenyl-diphosphatase
VASKKRLAVMDGCFPRRAVGKTSDRCRSLATGAAWIDRKEIAVGVLMLVLGLSVLAGVVAVVLITRFPRADPAFTEAEKVGEELQHEGRFRRFLRSRLDPAVATGLMLTTVFLGFVLAGAIVGVSVWMIRRGSGVVGIDRSVERWADEQATPVSDGVLGAITHLGDTVTVIAVGSVVAAVGYWRWRRWSIPLFLIVVIAGQSLISNSIKVAVDRARPELRPRALFTGTSFPSGHTTAAAATYLAVALVLGIGASPRARALLAGGAVAIGVAVGSTRALLGVHWFSDVIAGLAIGWAWFGACAVAFGGRLMRFGAPAVMAARSARDRRGSVGARSSPGSLYD